MDFDEKEHGPYAVASSFLLIGRGHGRNQNAAGLQHRKRSVLRVAADRVEHDINVAEHPL